MCNKKPGFLKDGWWLAIWKGLCTVSRDFHRRWPVFCCTSQILCRNTEVFDKSEFLDSYFRDMRNLNVLKIWRSYKSSTIRVSASPRLWDQRKKNKKCQGCRFPRKNRRDFCCTSPFLRPATKLFFLSFTHVTCASRAIDPWYIIHPRSWSRNT